MRFVKSVLKSDGVIHTKTKILEIATMEFAEKDYMSASIRNIANRASVKHSVITYHFGSKEDLFYTVMDVLIEEVFILNETFNFSKNSTDPIKDFKNHLLEVSKFYYERPEFLKIVYKENLSNSPRIQKIQPQLDKLKEITKSNLMVIKNLGLIKDFPIDDSYLIFSGAFRSLFIHPQRNLIEHADKKLVMELLSRHVDQVVQLMIK